MKSQILMESTSGKFNYIGEPIKAIGYDIHKTNKRNNTIIIHTRNLTGRIYLQGCLTEQPKDWVYIPFDETHDYLEFYNLNKFNHQPTNMYFNIYGSYTYLRAILDRSYLDNGSGISYNNYLSHTNIITSGSNVCGYSNPIKTSKLNPKYDPIYSENIDLKIDEQKRQILSKMGTVEKILLIF